MKGTTVLLVAGLGVGVIAIVLMLKKKPVPVANSGYPINSAPGRAYSLGSLFSSLGQPGNPIFTPASGIAFLEGALTGGGNNSASLTSPDDSYFSGSGGSGYGGSGTDVGWDDGDSGTSFY